MNESSIATNVRSIVENGGEGFALTGGEVIWNALVRGPIIRSALIGSATLQWIAISTDLGQKNP
jgi:hypothetical protein